MKIDVEKLNFGGIEPYYADQARELIKSALEKKPTDALELMTLLQVTKPEDHMDPEVRYLQHLAINALSRSGIK